LAIRTFAEERRTTFNFQVLPFSSERADLHGRPASPGISPIPDGKDVPRSGRVTGKLYKRLLRDRYWANKTSPIV
jgi:hypothetical protein